VKRESKVTDCVSHVAVIISNNVAYTDRIVRLIEKWEWLTTSRMMNESTRMDHRVDVAGRSASPAQSRGAHGQHVWCTQRNKKIPAQPYRRRASAKDQWTVTGSGWSDWRRVSLQISTARPLLDMTKALLRRFWHRSLHVESLNAREYSLSERLRMTKFRRKRLKTGYSAYHPRC
jgi:hypothetical protein